MNPDNGEADGIVSLEEKQQQVTTKLVDVQNGSAQEVSELLFSGGQCVVRSLLSVASCESPVVIDENKVKELVTFKPYHGDANDVLDLVFKMEDEKMFNGYLLSEYLHPGKAPDLSGLQELVNQKDTQVCISLRATQTGADGKAEYAYHMAHITKIDLDNGIKVDSRSDTDDGDKVKRALEAGEKYDVYVFQKKSPA